MTALIAWIIFITSGLVLVLIFLRRMRLTYKDLVFQKNLAQQEEQEETEKEIESELAEGELADLDETPAAGKKKKISVRKTFMDADTHFSRGRLDEAEPLFLAVIDADDTHLDAHHKLGLLHMKREDFPNAELYFSKLVNLKKDPVYFSNLGAALYRQQRLIEAAEAYENAIAMDDKRAARLQSLAQVYYELGEDEKALKYFEMAAKRKHKDVPLKLILADYYERLERWEDAYSVLKDVLELEPYNKDAKAMLKEVKQRMA